LVRAFAVSEFGEAASVREVADAEVGAGEVLVSVKAAGMNTTDLIRTGDCLAVLPTLPMAVADMAYFDPPFGIGLDYPGYDDRAVVSDLGNNPLLSLQYCPPVPMSSFCVSRL